MVNPFEIIPELGERDRVLGRQSISNIITSLLLRLLRIRNLYLLSVIIACLVGLLTAKIAHSEELPTDAVKSYAVRSPSGWWTPKKEEFQRQPQLVIGMADRTDLKASELPTHSIQRIDQRDTAPKGTSIINFQTSGSPSVSVVDSLLTARTPPSSASLLVFLQPNYSVWESTVADSRSQTDVNQESVCPLLQVNYADWNLPITLYNASLRDGDVR